MTETLNPQTARWWQKGVLYQIYPRSFGDSNGDGIGDLAGITQKLDYLVWLGVDALWLSPIYPSPMADFGYDISNYTDIDPVFGDLAAFDRLVAEAHARNLKLIMDLVPNHTSDEHPWFVESRSSRDNPKRDWYIWRDPKPNGEPPNNWLGSFSGKAWEFDQTTGQYYLHLFDRKQPDLNWRNPQVREAMYGVMRFWFERGVDGFRIDVLPLLIKDEQLRDNPVNPNWKPGDPYYAQQIGLYNSDQPEMYEIIQEMRRLAEEYPERVLIGETYLPYPQLMRYYGEKLEGIHLPFNFELLLMAQWRATIVKDLVDTYEGILPQGAWPNWVLGNHDKNRIASRVGAAQARIAQMLLLTLRGTPTCYYGDELGMPDGVIPPELMTDPQGLENPLMSRDPARTPMQWDASPQAGFSTGTPWLPVRPDYAAQNVASETTDPNSFLSLFRRLTELRRRLAALSLGNYVAVDTGNPAVFGYQRNYAGEQILVLLNFTDAYQTLGLTGHGEILCSTDLARNGQIELSGIELAPDQGLVISLA